MAENLYEAMFVVDANKGGSEFPQIIQHIADLFTRYGAQIERMEKWGERKLSYPIKDVKRGIYILVYFRADGSAIAELRQAVNLSEQIVRVLILSADEPVPVTGELYGPDGQPVEPPEPADEEPKAEGEEKPQAEGEEKTQPEAGEEAEPVSEEA